MRVRPSMIVLLVLLPAACAAQVRIGSQAAPERPWRKSVDGLGLSLSVTTTPGRELVQAADRPQSGTPLLVHDANKVERNENFTIYLMFQNCRAADSGECGLSATYQLISPEGEVVVEQRDAPVWDGPPPPPDKLELGMAIWENVAFDVDPVGKYWIRAVVEDHVTGRTIVLQRPLELVEEAPARTGCRTVEDQEFCLLVGVGSGPAPNENEEPPGCCPDRWVREVHEVRRNESFDVFLQFRGCRPDDAGDCHLSARYSVLAPDDEVLRESKELPVWDLAPPPEGKEVRGAAGWRNVSFRAEPVGSYRVRAVVTDKVTGRSTTLERALDLMEAK